MVIDLVAQQDGETVEGAELTGMSYKVGRGGMLDGLDEALEGMGAGDEKAFTSQLVGGDLVGQDVEVTVKVTKVQEQQLPDFDDEFAQLASEFDTADELSADVRERLGRGKRLEQAAAARDAVLEALLERVDIPLPETVVTDELNSRRRNIEQQLAYAGITLEKYLEDEGQTEEEFEADLERRVRDAVVAQLLLDEVASKEELGVDQGELQQHLVMRAQQSGEDPQEFANHMFEHNHIPELVQEIRRGKALAQIVESATVTDASGNVVELKNLRPDGTIGEPRRAASSRGGRRRAAEAPRSRRRRADHGGRPPLIGRIRRSACQSAWRDRCPRRGDACLGSGHDLTLSVGARLVAPARRATPRGRLRRRHGGARIRPCAPTFTNDAAASRSRDPDLHAARRPTSRSPTHRAGQPLPVDDQRRRRRA